MRESSQRHRRCGKLGYPRAAALNALRARIDPRRYNGAAMVGLERPSSSKVTAAPISLVFQTRHRVALPRGT